MCRAPKNTVGVIAKDPTVEFELMVEVTRVSYSLNRVSEVPRGGRLLLLLSAQSVK